MNRKNPDPMESNIDMDNHDIVNLRDPQAHDGSHAATVSFVNTTINDSNAVINAFIVHSTKLLNFDWSRAVQLIPNCTP